MAGGPRIKSGPIGLADEIDIAVSVGNHYRTTRVAVVPEIRS